MTTQGTPAQAPAQPTYDGMMNTAAASLRDQAAELSRQADFAQLGLIPQSQPATNTNPANGAFQVAGADNVNSYTLDLQVGSDPVARHNATMPAAGGAYVPVGTSTVPIQPNVPQQPQQVQPQPAAEQMVLVRMQDGSMGQVAASSLNQAQGQPVVPQQPQQFQPQPAAPAQAGFDSKGLTDTMITAATTNNLSQSLNAYENAIQQLQQTQAERDKDIQRQEDINMFINRQPNPETKAEKQAQFNAEISLLSSRVSTANTQLQAQNNLVQQLKLSRDQSSHQTNLQTLAHINPAFGTEAGFNQLVETLVTNYGFNAEEVRQHRDPRMIAMAAHAVAHTQGFQPQPMPQPIPQLANPQLPNPLNGVPQVTPQAIVSNVGGFPTQTAGQGNINSLGFLQPNLDTRITNQPNDESIMETASAFLSEMAVHSGTDL